MHFFATTGPQTLLHGSTLSLNSSWILTLMRIWIRILLLTLVRIKWIRRGLDPQPDFLSVSLKINLCGGHLYQNMIFGRIFGSAASCCQSWSGSDLPFWYRAGSGSYPKFYLFWKVGFFWYTTVFIINYVTRRLEHGGGGSQCVCV
jgi:hypothetical protein